MVPKNNNNLAQNYQYPKFNDNNMEILVTKADHFINYNMFWDKVKSQANAIWLPVCGTTTGNKTLNDENINYINEAYKKYPIRAKDCTIRLSLTNRNDIRMLSRFVILHNLNSFR